VGARAGSLEIHVDPRILTRTSFAPRTDLTSTGASLRPRQVEVVTLDQLRAEPALAGMGVLRRGNRLSVMPVTPEEYRAVVAMAGRKARA